MTISRRQLYAMGETFGDSATAEKPGGGRIYGGGDGGDSSQTSATTTTSTTNVQDRRIVADAGATVAGEGAHVNVTNNTTDLGAVKAGTDLAEAALLGATKTATEANARAGSLAVAALDLTKGAVGELKGAYEASGKQVGVYAMIFVGGLVLFAYAVRGQSKGSK